jgi:hypothetical protein
VLDFHGYDKMPEKNNLNKERFILVHGFSPLAGCTVAGLRQDRTSC